MNFITEMLDLFYANKHLYKRIGGADVAPVVHGYWKGKPIVGNCTVLCSACGSAFLDNDGRWNYCPNCGAKMDGEKGFYDS